MSVKRYKSSEKALHILLHSANGRGGKSRHILLLSVLVGMIVFLVGGCDLLMLGPSPRSNWNDPKVGVVNFRPIITGGNSVRAAWDWIDLELSLSHSVFPEEGADIDKVVIKHSAGGPPSSRLGGEVYSLDDYDVKGNTLWHHDFDKLDRDREHYFALYMHKKNGRWLAPVYANEYLDQNMSLYPKSRSYNQYNRIDLSAQNFEETPVDSKITDQKWGIYYFDVYDPGTAVKNGEIEISLIPSLKGEIIIHPLRMPVNSFDSVTKSVAVNRTVKVSKSLDGSESTVRLSGNQVEDLVSKVFYYGTGGVVLYNNDTTEIEVTDITLYYDEVQEE